MSLLPADTPRLPKWPFLAGDAMLLGLAFLIGCYARNPFAGKPLILIVASVALGAVLAAVPFIADYAHQRDEVLDERQRGLEALAHTITSSAEQIGIAAQNLPGIAETAAKSLKLAEQLPARLQEKVGEIKQHLAEVSAAKKGPSASEPTALRAGESEHLATTADHIRQAAAELAKFEAIAQKNLAAARGELDARAAQIFKQLDAKIAAFAALAEKFSAPAVPLTAEKPARGRTPTRKEPETPPARPEPFRQTQGPEPVEGPARGEPVESAERAVAEKPAMVEAVAPEIPAEESKAPRKRAPKKPKSESLEPSLDFDASAKSTDSSPTPSSAMPTPASSTGGDEFSQPSPDEAAPATAVSADGATRLLVTAYIGIGNKLFLRGDGPGLSWDEGVPLQFISIGKWRWETADATAPVHAKLYKNDEIVCAALGKLTLNPGQQAEVTAAF